MKNLKKLTILHSNDMHEDFMAEEENGALIGGVSMLSGYIQKVRAEEKNVLYTISGDMFRGSVIDSEFKGLSTIEIMNMLGPDVATLGNHEIDYGIGHLLFLEKCARFPIVNANLYLTTNQIRLFKSHVILEVDGMKILFIGVLTEEVLAQAAIRRPRSAVCFPTCCGTAWGWTLCWWPRAACVSPRWGRWSPCVS